MQLCGFSFFFKKIVFCLFGLSTGLQRAEVGKDGQGIQDRASKGFVIFIGLTVLLQDYHSFVVVVVVMIQNK